MSRSFFFFLKKRTGWKPVGASWWLSGGRGGSGRTSSVLKAAVFLCSRMRLRVQVQGQKTTLELQGEEPSLAELVLLIREVVLPSVGLRSEPGARWIRSRKQQV